MNYGIIFEGDTTPLASELAEALRELGLTDYSGSTLTRELLSSLNDYRTANFMPELDFCDPTVLRTLGIETEGDEILTVATVAEAMSENEVSCYDICEEIVRESKHCQISLTEAALRRADGIDRLPEPSANAAAAALLALLNN